MIFFLARVLKKLENPRRKFSPQFEVVEPEHENVSRIAPESQPTPILAQLVNEVVGVEDAGARLVGCKLHFARKGVRVPIVETRLLLLLLPILTPP